MTSLNRGLSTVPVNATSLRHTNYKYKTYIWKLYNLKKEYLSCARDFARVTHGNSGIRIM